MPAATETNRSESNDILYQSGPITVKANQVQNIWVSFAIPKDAKAGTYTTTLTATADGMENAAHIHLHHRGEGRYAA